MKTIDGINYYEQSDVDNITEKVKINQQAKYEKTHIDLAKYQELEARFNDVVLETKKSGLKEVFKTQGGNINAFEDFVTTNKEFLELDGDNLATKFSEIKKLKPFYFDTPTTNTTTINLQDGSHINDLLGKDNKGLPLVEGTIYKSKI